MAKKPVSQRAVKPAAKKPVKKPTPKPTAAKKATKQPVRKAKPKPAAMAVSWFDVKSHKPLIGEYAGRLDPVIAALANGRIDDAELRAQENRLVALMKEIEPKLSAAMHGSITQLLCELTAYDVMQMLHTMHATKPQTAFRG